MLPKQLQPYPSEVVHVDSNKVIWQHLQFGAYPGVDKRTAEYIQSYLCCGDRHSKPAGQEKEKKRITFGSHDRTGPKCDCTALRANLTFIIAVADVGLLEWGI